MPKRFNQAAVVPVRGGRIGLVTSSNGRRWIVPKGSIDPGHTAREAAAVEAWEEAGWIGVVEEEPAGSYSYVKEGRDRHVLVFLMTVTEERATWPEMGERVREWVTAEEAIERLPEPELQSIVRSLAAVGA